MRKYFTIILILFCIILTSCKNNTQEIDAVFNLSELEIEKVKDATPKVVEAFKLCKEKGIKKIQFPKGVYHFYPTFAPDIYCAITNNDNGMKRTAFPVLNFKELEIDGNGSEFIFHGKILPFIIENSENISIKNLSVNWEVPFYLQGEVVANNASNNTFDIQPITPYKVTNGHLYLRTEREDSPFNDKFGERFAIAQKYDQIAAQNIIWDKTTMAPIYNTDGYSGFNSIGNKAEEIDDKTVRLHSSYKKVPPIGAIFCSKGEYLQNRTHPAFRLFKSKNISFNKVNVHHAGAMGLIAERCENISLDSFNVVLKEGENRMVTTTADATHFCNCKGLISIKNCIFENMLDDATNIHGTYTRINTILDDYRIAVETYHPHQNGYLFAEAGDSIQIIHKDKLIPTTEKLEVTNVEYVNEKISILTFKESLKSKVNQHDGVENMTWYPSAIIENNIVRNNRARSFLISTPKKVIVRNNELSSQMSSLRITGDLNLWNESGACDSLIIENNLFKDNGYNGGTPQPVILIDPQYLSKKNMVDTYSKNIFIKNNTFKTFDASILKAISVDGLVFENNKIEQTQTYNPLFPNHVNFSIVNSKDISIKENTYRSISGQEGTLSIDDNSTKVTIEGNVGF